jgi:SAM-dependent methyltransferase
MKNNSYIIKGGCSGADRLRVLGEAVWPSTERLLRRIEICEGMGCLDFGCGGGDVSVKLAELVGASGSVTGIDMDSQVLQRARALAEKKGVEVNFVQQKCAAFDQQNRYDLAYARFILSHLTDPGDSLRRLLDSIKPGGWILAEDINISSHLYYPPNDAVARYIEIYEESARRRGADPNIGQKLPAMFVHAGVQEIGVDVAMPLFLSGPGKSIARLTLTNIAESAIESGITDSSEVDRLLDDITTIERDSTTIISTAQIIQVWGRKSVG